jgi:hypothetical protein
MGMHGVDVHALLRPPAEKTLPLRVYCARTMPHVLIGSVQEIVAQICRLHALMASRTSR